MKLLTTLILIAAAGPVYADTAAPSVSVSPLQADRYGCVVRQRPDELTYSGFRDAWRAIPPRTTSIACDDTRQR